MALAGQSPGKVQTGSAPGRGRGNPMSRRLLRIAVLLLLVLGGLAMDAFLQARGAAELDVGGRDLGYVGGFSAKEWSTSLAGPAGPEQGTFRWMSGSGTILLGPVRAGQPLLVRLRMARPAGPANPPMQLRAGEQLSTTFPLGPTLQEYAFLVPPAALRSGSLRVALQVAPFQVPGDDRDLGLVLERARLEVLADGPGGGFGALLLGLRPAYGLVVLAVALTALALGLSFGWSWGLGAGALLLAGGAAAFRPDVVVQAGPTLTTLAVLTAAVAGGLRLLGPRWRAVGRWLGDRAAAVLLILFFLSLALSFFPHIEADGIEYYAYLRSLAFDGDLYFANELSLETARLFPHVPYGLGSKTTATGYQPNFASVGPAIVWTPFFAVGHLLALGGHALGMPWTLDGYSEPYVVLICFGSTLSTLVTLLLGYDLVRRFYGPSLGLLATTASFLGTGLFYYAFYKPDFAHALAACAVTVFVYLWARTLGRRTPWQWLGLGLAAGFMTTLYWIDALFVVVVALELLWEAGKILTRWNGRRTKNRGPRTGGLGSGRGDVEAGEEKPGASAAPRQLRPLGSLLLGGLLFAAAFLVAFAPQMIAWKVLYGQWFTVPQEGFANVAGFAALELLFSPLHGLLPWTPVALLGMAGLGWLAWQKRPWGLFVLLGLLLYFLYNATLGSWHGGGYFGLRRLTNAFPFFLLGVGALLHWLRRRRAEGALLAALLPTLWGLLVLLRYLVYAMPHYPQELEGLSLPEFLLAPTNMPVERLPEALRLSFLVQWVDRLAQRFRPADLAYGLALLVLFAAAAWGVWKGLGARLGKQGRWRAES